MATITPYQFDLREQTWMIKLPNKKNWRCFRLQERHVWFDQNGNVPTRPLTFSESRLTTKPFQNKTHRVRITAYKNGFLAVNVTPKKGQM